KSVRVHEDKPQSAHQIGPFQVSQLRIGLRHKQRIAMRQRGDECRIDGEVVVLDMTRATRPAVTLKPLFQEDLASLCNDFREIEVPCGSRRRIEPGRRALVIDKSHLAVKEPVENGGRTGQYERVQRTLARHRYESAIGKKVNELLWAEGREELVHSL